MKIDDSASRPGTGKPAKNPFSAGGILVVMSAVVAWLPPAIPPPEDVEQRLWTEEWELVVLEGVIVTVDLASERCSGCFSMRRELVAVSRRSFCMTTAGCLRAAMGEVLRHCSCVERDDGFELLDV